MLRTVSKIVSFESFRRETGTIWWKIFTNFSATISRSLYSPRK